MKRWEWRNFYPVIWLKCIYNPPLSQCGFPQCLPFSWKTLRGKHSWHPIAIMRVVDTFVRGQFLISYRFEYRTYELQGWHAIRGPSHEVHCLISPPYFQTFHGLWAHMVKGSSLSYWELTSFHFLLQSDSLHTYIKIKIMVYWKES